MSEDFKVVREYNYVITIYDKKKRKIQFRDITGKDLEFLERILGEEKEGGLELKDAISILEKINVTPIKISRLTKKDILQVFKAVSENILCNYVPKVKWLEVCYALQNNSFVALEFFENQPMTKVMAMIQVHKNAVEQIKKPPQDK
tara:strand:- start:537 stop:974 length:438 start_codon:yes stop_codon:yes gene_type:complete